MNLKIKFGNITKEQTDAIVNAANESLMPGGGVDGAITTAAGAAALNERMSLGGCKTGDAVAGSGGNLNCEYIIYTVGPRYSQGRNDLLASAYQKSIELAIKNNCKSIAFPAISAGIYGYPADIAAKVAINTATGFKDQDIDITFVLFTNSVYNAFQKELEKLND